MNIWSSIVRWFKNRTDRVKLVDSFNASAKEAYVSGNVPAMLMANVTKGDSNYKHMFSKLLGSGFRIKVFTGRQLERAELISIGNVILANATLVRRLIVLGWDTLEVCGSTGKYGCKWRLIDYIEEINLIGNFNGLEV